MQVETGDDETVLHGVHVRVHEGRRHHPPVEVHLGPAGPGRPHQVERPGRHDDPAAHPQRVDGRSPGQDDGSAVQDHSGARSSYGTDSTVVVWVDTLASARMRARSASRSPMLETWTFSR